MKRPGDDMMGHMDKQNKPKQMKVDVGDNPPTRATRSSLPRYVVRCPIKNGTEQFGVKLKLFGRNLRIGSSMPILTQQAK